MRLGLKAILLSNLYECFDEYRNDSKLWNNCLINVAISNLLKPNMAAF